MTPNQRSGMLIPLTPERHHIFLLVTPAYRSVTIGPETVSAPRIRNSMPQPSTGFVVAVVDDDHGILRSLEYLLESADYAVRVFTSAAALLDSGCLPEIDCLISDIDMPGMDGFELLRQVHGARPGLPIIFITGYPETLTRLPPLGASNPRFFTKPFQGPELLGAVSDALRGRDG